MALLPLHGFTIIDLSHRLPGPFAGKVLASLGAKVIKIEDYQFKDPFLEGLFASFDESFLDWYQNLNEEKEVLRFDFNHEEDAKKIAHLIQSADGVIMGLPPKTRVKLKLTASDLEFDRPFVAIELLASKVHQRSLHDLNALADAGLLSMHLAGRNEDIVDPPFLPISGISFGHKAATDFLAVYIQSQKKQKSITHQCYLDESTELIYGTFWPKKDRAHIKKYLHNGKYPCYSLYKTSDGHYLALSLVEEKFWNRFCELFQVDKTLDRFCAKDESVFMILKKTIQKLSSEEIERRIGTEDLCISIVHH